MAMPMRIERSELEAKLQARRSLPAPGERARLRKAAGLAQDDIARSVGVTRSAVSRWEAGCREPRGRTLVAYVEVLELLRVSGEIAPTPDARTAPGHGWSDGGRV
jgi:DNA-binding transcriptional regulator YiaG